MKNTLAAVLLTLAVCGCSAAKQDLIGTWVEPIPSMPGHTQGFSLQDGGKASSVNMATLVYDGWEVQDGNLILNGKSIGNGQTISFTETMKIDKLNENELVLSNNGVTRHYTRQE